MRALEIVKINGKNIDEREEYTKVTNAGVMCKKCNKPIASSIYVKIFKVKNYLPENGFAEHEMLATKENCGLWV